MEVSKCCWKSFPVTTLYTCSYCGFGMANLLADKNCGNTYTMASALSPSEAAVFHSANEALIGAGRYGFEYYSIYKQGL